MTGKTDSQFDDLQDMLADLLGEGAEETVAALEADADRPPDDVAEEAAENETAQLPPADDDDPIAALQRVMDDVDEEAATEAAAAPQGRVDGPDTFGDDAPGAENDDPEDFLRGLMEE